jgi:drug/metabolite transporter (DMT)-like permease
MEYSKKGIMAIVACAALWSVGGLFIKLVDWHPLVIAGTRSLVASVVLLVYLRRPKITFSFPQIAAAVCNTATMILFVSSTKLTTAANAILLQYSAPVFAAFFGWLLVAERPKIEQWLSLVFVAIGMAVFFMDSLAPGSDLGNLLAAVSGITFGLFSVFMRMQKSGSPLESYLLSHLLTVLIAIPFALTVPFPPIRAVALGSIAVLGVVQIGVSAILFSYAIKRVTAVQAMLLAVIEPLLNPVWVFLVTGERPGVNSFLGGAVIIAAVTASSIITVRRSQASARAEAAVTN